MTLSLKSHSSLKSQTVLNPKQMKLNNVTLKAAEALQGAQQMVQKTKQSQKTSERGHFIISEIGQSRISAIVSTNFHDVPPKLKIFVETLLFNHHFVVCLSLFKFVES